MDKNFIQDFFTFIKDFFTFIQDSLLLYKNCVTLKLWSCFDTIKRFSSEMETEEKQSEFNFGFTSSIL